MYLYPNEVEELLDELKSMSPKCKIIVGLGKQNLFSKIGKFITGNINAHNDTRSSYNSQINIILKKSKLIDKKENIFFMTDIFYSEFY